MSILDLIWAYAKLIPIATVIILYICYRIKKGEFWSDKKAEPDKK